MCCGATVPMMPAPGRRAAERRHQGPGARRELGPRLCVWPRRARRPGREEDRRDCAPSAAGGGQPGLAGIDLRRDVDADAKRAFGSGYLGIREAVAVRMREPDVDHRLRQPRRRKQQRLPRQQRGNAAEEEIRCLLAQIERVARPGKTGREGSRRAAERGRGHRPAAMPA